MHAPYTMLLVKSTNSENKNSTTTASEFNLCSPRRLRQAARMSGEGSTPKRISVKESFGFDALETLNEDVCSSFFGYFFKFHSSNLFPRIHLVDAL